MRCILVDDEPLARQRLARLLAEEDGYETVGEAGSGYDALELAARLRPDIALLDIAMPGMDGLELAGHLNRLSSPPAIVFCTAFDEHALAAFDANAVDYLVKPIRRERLGIALHKAHRFTHEELAAVRPEESLGRHHICARVRGNLELIPIDSVLYFHAEHKYVTVHHTGGEVLIEEALTSLEKDLNSRFIRIHRNALVDQTRLAGLVRKPDGHFCVKITGCDTQLDVSRRNLPYIRKLLKNFS